MPSLDDTMENWADQVTDGDELPPPHEQYDDVKGIKTVIEYRLNEDGKKVRSVKTFSVEKRKVSKSVAKRKAWRKYGAAKSDPPGPNPSNTIVAEEIFMQFVHTKEAQNTEAAAGEKDPLEKLKAAGTGKMVSCRYCKGDHWSKECPHKDKLEALDEMKKKAGGAPGDAAAAAQAAGGGPGGADAARAGKYIPPSQRDGAKRGTGVDVGGRGGQRDETATIRVTNLSEDTQESDLQELFAPFGNISRIFLAKDKVTGQSKGFAFINYYARKDAAAAIEGVSGHGFDHLILNVEWAKPSAQ